MNIDKVPSEVAWVMAIQYYGEPIGLDTWKEIQAIIDKYPDYFPWEHKYKSIPQEVHDAYRKETDPTWGMTFEEYFQNAHTSDGSFKGLIPLIQEKLYHPIPDEPITVMSITQIFENLSKQEDDRVKREKERLGKDKAIWDKHYKQYDLQYRP